MSRANGGVEVMGWGAVERCRVCSAARIVRPLSCGSRINFAEKCLWRCAWRRTLLAERAHTLIFVRNEMGQIGRAFVCLCVFVRWKFDGVGVRICSA